MFAEPHQGASCETLLDVARVAEAEGFDGSDHYLATGGDGLLGPTDASR